ncbi:hypothetical protein G7Z17_g12459 [Cylindrodendrum hubeiense]|uniref:Uncharacterized protein n=1 Tax=Cylindrodendrum hubeiense TaxID=595255 RepID=A0A9P5GYV4_9HYPO|nr:hypothetical protein G7Z17_g12459 [Cylindrodendrum hubeiense]
MVSDMAARPPDRATPPSQPHAPRGEPQGPPISTIPTSSVSPVSQLRKRSSCRGKTDPPRAEPLADFYSQLNSQSDSQPDSQPYSQQHFLFSPPDDGPVNERLAFRYAIGDNMFGQDSADQTKRRAERDAEQRADKAMQDYDKKFTSTPDTTP